jgi:hypothetical protein
MGGGLGRTCASWAWVDRKIGRGLWAFVPRRLTAPWFGWDMSREVNGLWTLLAAVPSDGWGRGDDRDASSPLGGKGTKWVLGVGNESDQVKEGHLVNALALRGDEGRGTLR